MKIYNDKNVKDRDAMWEGIIGLYRKQSPHFVELMLNINTIGQKAKLGIVDDVEEVLKSFEELEEPMIKVCSYNSSRIEVVNKNDISDRWDFEVDLLDKEVLSDFLVSYKTYLMVVEKIVVTENMTIADMKILDKSLDMFYTTMDKLMKIQAENAELLAKKVLNINLGE